MKSTYRVLSPAEEELAKAAVYYNAESEGFGHDFLDNVQRTIDLLCANTQLGPRITNTFRSMPLSRFPFIIIYTLETDGILIVAVAHHRRRPGYWKGRLQE